MKHLMIAAVTLAVSSIATAKGKNPQQGWDFFRQIVGPCHLHTIQDPQLLKGALENVKSNLSDGFELVSVTKIDPTKVTPVAPNHCVYTYVRK